MQTPAGSPTDTPSEHPGSFSLHSWWVYVCAMAVLTSAYACGQLSGPAWLKSGLVFDLIGGATIAALVLGCRRNSGRSRLPWYLFAVGQGLFVTSDVLSSNYERLFGNAMPFPSIVDPFHLAFYPFLVAGMLLLIRERDERRDRAGLIDSLIVTLALATLLWVYLIAPYADSQSWSLLQSITSIAYPAMDILVLGVVARVAAGSHRREPSFVFLLSGTVVLLLSDGFHGVRLLDGGYNTGGILDIGWAIYYVLLGASALHPSMRQLSEPGPETDGHLTRARLALLSCASFTAPLLIFVRVAVNDHLDLYVLVGASAAMFALVLLRMAGIVRRNEELAVQMVKLTEESVSKAFLAELEHQAFHDILTGLPNRALFRNRVEHALPGQLRGGMTVAVLFLDIDNFKDINDSLGHVAGDEVLQEVGRRLDGCMRPVDTAARLGGDEFAVLIQSSEGEAHAIEIAHRVMTALAPPLTLAGRQITIATSIGVAFGGGGASSSRDANELLHDADAAMYMVKQAGKGGYQVFQPEMHAQALVRLELKADLQRALQAHEFTPRYQPIMDLRRGDIAGSEALARWEHPTRGTVSPAEFIPLLEETGLIASFGHRMLTEACEQAVLLQEECPREPPLMIAVNVSAFQLRRPEFIDEVRSVLAETGIEPSSLVLELTESMMIQDMDLSIRRMSALRSLGVRLAIDDFGTGYSSLTYLRRLPVDILKIDRSFVADPSQEATLLTAAIVQLARIFKLQVVLEGIENASHLERVDDMRCDFGQGFHFARPLSAADMMAVAARQSQTGAPNGVGVPARIGAGVGATLPETSISR